MMLKDLMMKKKAALKVLLLSVIAVAGFYLPAQETRMTAEEYIDRFYEIAVKEMQRTGIPASIKLAQGLFETGFGNSRLAREANNHFGIKCHKEWSGPTISEDDDAPQECFRVYTDPIQSYIDHSSFLMTRPRYSNLFNFPSNDYKSWAHGLKQAGYATNPNYAYELITRIERFELQRFDDPEYVHVPVSQQALTASVDKNFPLPENPLQVTVQNSKKLDLAVCEPVSPSLVVCKVKTTFNNGIKATKSVAGDTPRELAARAGVDLKDFLKYNECHPDWLLPEGTYMYFSPKASKNNLASSYQVKPGDNMWLISQRYGVKEATLRKRNLMGAKEEPNERQIVYINKKTKNKPQLSKSPVQLATYPYDKPIPPVVEVQRPIERPVAAVNEPAPAAEPVYQVIELPKAQSPQVTVQQEVRQPVQAAANVKTHLVQPKETLYGISRMYGVTIDQLVEWNRLPEYNISIGALLIVGK